MAEVQNEQPVKEAKLQVKLEDIKFNEANKTMAILACIPLVGLIIFFVEKNDQFVRYMGAQFGILGVVAMVCSILAVIPVLGWIIACFGVILGLAAFVMMIMAMVKTSKGERFDVPVVSGFAIQLMNAL